MKRLALLAACAALFAAPALADPSVKVVCLTSGSTWTVPSDFTTRNTVELIGAGGPGAHNAGNGFEYGGGGGAYSASTSYALTPGASVAIQVGSNLNTCFSSCATQKAARGDPAGAGGIYPGPGGTVANSVGTTRFAGGSGSLAGPGGGAAGPNGAGANGTVAPNVGGAGDAGFGGAGGNPNGGNGAEWTCTGGDITGPAGAGGGAGGTAPGSVGTAGRYGAGGYSSTQGGLIVITYIVRRASSGVF